MAYRDIRIIGDPILRTECEWITDIDDAVKQCWLLRGRNKTYR